MNVFFSPELPEDVIKMAKDVKPITEIKQNGNDFVVTSKTPGKTLTNSFTIGKEADITTMDGKKLKVCLPVWSELAVVIHILIISVVYHLHKHTVHCLDGGGQTGLQDWKVLSRAGAQRWRDD